MKKFMLAAALALSTVGVASTSNAAVISATGAATQFSGLTGGNQYFLNVSGTVIFAPGRSADAAFVQRQIGQTVWDDTAASGFDVGLRIVGAAANLNFGPFNPANTYQLIFTAPLSGAISVFFRDNFASDNSGTLNASVSAVPLPASMLGLLAGLAGLGFLRRRKTA